MSENERETQMHFLPTQKVQPEMINIRLEDLPENKDIPGDPPTREMVDSIKRYGILQPIMAMLPYPTLAQMLRYEIVDGGRRVKALRVAIIETEHDQARGKALDYMLPLPIVPARVFQTWPQGEQEGWDIAEVLLLIANEQRSSNPLAELRAIERLMEQGYNEKGVQAVTGMSPSTLKARLALQRLVPGLRDLLEQGLVTSAWAEMAAKQSTGLQERLLALFEAEGKVTKKDISQARKASSGAFWGTVDETVEQQSFQVEEEINARHEENPAIGAQPRAWAEVGYWHVTQALKALPSGVHFARLRAYLQAYTNELGLVYPDLQEYDKRLKKEQSDAAEQS